MEPVYGGLAMQFKFGFRWIAKKTLAEKEEKVWKFLVVKEISKTLWNINQEN